MSSHSSSRYHSSRNHSSTNHSTRDRGNSNGRRHHSGRHRTPEDDVSHLKFQSYTGRELARMLRRNASRSIWDKLTPTEADIMREPLPEWAQSHGLAEVKKYLNEYLLILDKAYFFRAVGKHIRQFKVLDVNDPSRREGEEGSWQEATGTMKLNLRAAPNASGTSTVWEDYVGTLVHEMLHAFLDSYCCHCRKCKGNRSNSRTGYTGHGAVWANAMIAIQDSMVRDLPWRTNCGILESVNLECRQTGWIPRDEQLERWRVRLDAGLERQAERGEVYEDGDADYESDEEEDGDFLHGAQVVCCTVM